MKSVKPINKCCMYLAEIVLFNKKNMLYIFVLFRGPLNWYRTMEKDWQWNCKISGRKVMLELIIALTDMSAYCSAKWLITTLFDRVSWVKSSSAVLLGTATKFNDHYRTWHSHQTSVLCKNGSLGKKKYYNLFKFLFNHWVVRFTGRIFHSGQKMHCKGSSWFIYLPSVEWYKSPQSLVQFPFMPEFFN